MKMETLKQQILTAKGDVRAELVLQGIYAVPEALLNTMIDVERIVPKGVVCLYNAWAENS